MDRICFLGQAFGRLVKMPLAMSISHVGVPGFESCLHCRFHLPANGRAGRHSRWPKYCVCHHMGGAAGVPRSWLQPCPVGILGAEEGEPTEGRSPCLYISVFLPLM